MRIILRLNLYSSTHIRFEVYYRIYAKDNALKVINPIYSNDGSISRVWIKSITPPRNVASLKRHLWKVEGFDGTPACTLYLSSSVNAPAEDLVRLPPRGLGSGSSELDPIALVVDTPEVEKRSAGVRMADLTTFPEWPHKQLYGTRLLLVRANPLIFFQCITVFIMRTARLRQRRPLIRLTHPWVALTCSAFRHLITALH